MPDPFETNDDWAELARELARDNPPAPPAPPADRVERLSQAESVEPHHNDPRADEEAGAEGEVDAATDEEFEDAEDGPGGESAEGEQPGTGRKRRRRRRRRRKGGPAADAGTAPVSEGGGGGVIPAADEPTFEPAAEAPEDDFDASETGDTDAAPGPFGEEEDTASEVLRDLIATWNVPSWEDIVGGLYRPN